MTDPTATKPPSSEQCAVFAAKWWADALRGAPRPALDGFSGEGATYILYTMATYRAPASKLDAFEQQLARSILEKLEGVLQRHKAHPTPRPPSVDLTTDYGPGGLLGSVMFETGCCGSVPMKTDMSVFVDYVTLSVVRGQQDVVLFDVRPANKRWVYWNERLRRSTDSLAWYENELNKNSHSPAYAAELRADYKRTQQDHALALERVREAAQDPTHLQP